MLEQWLLLLGSGVANFLSALAGGGAGLLQLPLLLFMGLPFSVALATHKVASVFLGLGAGLRSAKGQTFVGSYSAVLLCAGLPGVWLGTRLILHIPDGIAELLLGLMTVALGVYSFTKKNMGLIAHEVLHTPRQWVIGAGALFGIGVLNGSLTSGTGLFVTLLLVRYWGMTYKAATAYTLFFVGLFWNGLGGLSLWHSSAVKVAWLPALIAGSLVGGYLGVWFAQRQSNQFIKRAFEVLTLLAGAKLIYGAMLALA